MIKLLPAGKAQTIRQLGQAIGAEHPLVGAFLGAGATGTTGAARTGTVGAAKVRLDLAWDPSFFRYEKILSPN